MKEREEEEWEQVKNLKETAWLYLCARESGAISWLQLVRGMSQVRVLLSVQQMRTCVVHEEWGTVDLY